MKAILIFILFLFSSFTKTPAPFIKNVYGVWKGYYGNENEINPIIIHINPQNKAELFFNYSEGCITSSGYYKVLGDSAIVISTLKPGSKTPEVLLYGNLYKTVSFIDGQWVVSSKQKGCFFLQKQLPMTDL